MVRITQRWKIESLFGNKQYHQKLKYDCNKDKVGDLKILLSKTITLYSTFTS